MKYDNTQPAYLALRDIVAERTSPMVAFVGAGLSRTAGLPSWRELQSRLVSTLRSKANVLFPEEVHRFEGIAEAALKQQSLWVSFEMLQEALGKETYRSEIKRIFAPAVKAVIPREYNDLLALRLSGVITSNVDRLVTRAFAITHKDALPIEFSGINCGSYSYILQHSRPFILNLHGVHEQEDSWVFTHSSLIDLQKVRGYKDLLRAVFMSRTVVFAGITADDVSVGSHLEALTTLGINGGGHFWITDRGDTVADKWAENNGIRIIRYRSEGNDHSALGEMLTDLRKYVPPEIIAAPVESSFVPPAAHIRPLEELMREQDRDAIRRELNAHASWILSNRTADSYSRYSEFLKKYDPAVYLAWYVSTDSPHNVLFGYTIKAPVGEGAFGNVFEATNAAGQKCAIKVLRADIRQKPDMLQSFRRGVLSMKILSDASIPGMVPYEYAAEIPACTVMEFIEGPNLEEHVRTGQMKDWEDILDVSRQITQIISKAHALPQRVLHRDIRPPNIMLADYYSTAQLNVAVLDFDLSWHMGATEASISHQNSANPYLAPEQIDPGRHVSTRSAAVDSFGIGMTMFFLRTARDPLPGQFRHDNWAEHVQQVICNCRCKQWHSLPLRFARLILNCTREKQQERWDISQILGELTRLQEAISSAFNVKSAELIAEEILARAAESSGNANKYSWSENDSCGAMSFASGMTLRIIGDEQKRSVSLQMQWVNQGFSKHQNIKKYIPDLLSKVSASCRSAGWNEDELRRSSADSVGCVFSIPASSAANQIENLSTGVDLAVKAFMQITRM